MPPHRATPARQRRDALVTAVKQRGRANANLWYVYDPGRRTSVVLVGDLAHELFLATEGDPAVVLASYEKVEAEYVADGVARTVTFDALVMLANGHRECRDAHETALGTDPRSEALLAHKRAGAAALGAAYVEWLPADLDRLRQRIRNWSRAIAALARCRGAALAYVEGLIRLHVAANERQTLGELVEALAAHASAAIVIAATVSLLRQRAVGSDLDSHTWCLHTAIWQVPA